VLGWGQNMCGQVNGEEISESIIYSPVLVKKLSGTRVKGIGAYKSSSFAFTEDGKITEWGAKIDFPDTNNNVSSNSPTQPFRLIDLKIKNIMDIKRGN
jgi:hypothetical protein